MATRVALSDRSMQTLVASWAEPARGAIGATVQRFPGAAVAVFPNGPECQFYNNAPLDRGLGRASYANATIEFGAPDWCQYVRILGMGPDHLGAAITTPSTA